jgi:hypothetical protein
MPQMQILISSFLKVPRGMPKYIIMMMDMAQDFSECDPGELLAERIDYFLYDDLNHNVVTDIENNADDISCIKLVDKHDDDTCDGTMAYALTQAADSQCADIASTMHSFDQTIDSIRH